MKKNFLPLGEVQAKSDCPGNKLDSPEYGIQSPTPKYGIQPPNTNLWTIADFPSVLRRARERKNRIPLAEWENQTFCEPPWPDEDLNEEKTTEATNE